MTVLPNMGLQPTRRIRAADAPRSPGCFDHVLYHHLLAIQVAHLKGFESLFLEYRR